jgi:O-antigen ligase
MSLGNAPTNIFMALTLMAWVIAGGYKERFQKISGNQLAWSALALFALICVGALYSTGEISDIKYQLLKYTKLLFLVVAISLLQDKKWRDWGMNAFALAMLITLTLSLANVVSPISFVKGTAHGAVGNHYVFKDHIAQNLIMSFFAILMLVRSQVQPTKLRQYIYLLIAACSIIDIIFFVQGRTGFISLAANTTIFVVYFAPKKNRKIWFSCVLLVALALLYSSNNFNSRVKLAIDEFKQQDKKELSSIGQRVEFTNKSLALIKESPVFGFGTGSYAKEFCRIAISEEWCQAGKFHPHNQFMAFGVQLGLLGIFVYGIFLYSAANLARQFPLPEKVIGLALVATLIVDSFLHAPLFLITEAQFFTLLLALTMSNTSLKEKIHDD